MILFSTEGGRLVFLERERGRKGKAKVGCEGIRDLTRKGPGIQALDRE